ncbi:hypothetical protein Acsp03_71050 [Actinomadura sp. NBRC 104412]|uniref:hypothetical protein n=1 Tax=Actinomadura sp. NBRC 104412 TaxID=3032203 RepID=UPI0024A10D93|nr:hypothetical protein [Actinomadura sp. NBRC 104412]GLZ09639.1 hypothetical protein Acsp03_71050 [Actinomadura sp. NBRC 104412]
MTIWRADPAASLRRRLGKSAVELGDTTADPTCPDIWELDNGDVAFIGTDLTDEYTHRLPEGVSIGANERLVVLPRNVIVAARPDLPGA